MTVTRTILAKDDVYAEAILFDHLPNYVVVHVRARRGFNWWQCPPSRELRAALKPFLTDHGLRLAPGARVEKFEYQYGFGRRFLVAPA